MPNINQRIDPIRRGSLPDLRRGVNETIDRVNWLMGMRVNNGTISEGGRGPIIDIPSVAAAGPTPWATDPDGNSADWKLATFIDTTTGNYFDAWIWAGGTKNVRPVPWLTDPSGIIADWVVCADNTFWGTGNCPVGVGNFQSIHFTSSGPGTNPYTYTGNVSSPPITPPTSPPAFYLLADSGDTQSGVTLPRQPILRIIMAVGTGNPPVSVSYTWNITYDGTSVFSISGSETTQTDIYVLIDPKDWLYDPGGLPGYSQGSKKWVWQYQGVISTNTNPTIVETLSYSGGAPVAGVINWSAVVFTK